MDDAEEECESERSHGDAMYVQAQANAGLIFIVLQMTVTISEQAMHLFRQHKVDCHQFLESKKSGSCTVKDVGGTYQLTGSYKAIKRIRDDLFSQLKMLTAGEHQQPQAMSSLQNTKDIEQQASTQETRNDRGGNDVRATPLTSQISLQGDAMDKCSQSREGQMSPDVAMQESLVKPKRVRRLKSPMPEDDTLVVAGAQTGAADSRVEERRASVEEKRKFNESSDYERIEVDRDRHDYLMTHFGDELKKQLPPFHIVNDEPGKHIVAFALNSKKTDRKNIKDKYKSYLDRFRFEIVGVPDGVDGSVLHSRVPASDDKDTSFVLDEVNKVYKLMGKKKQVDKMKKLILEHISEQLKTPSKHTEGAWEEQNSKRNRKKTAFTYLFYIDNGKLYQCESFQSPATKNGSLQVSLLDSKTKSPATEAIVRAVDCKMQSFGDSKAAIKFESVNKYKDECRKIVNEHHNSIPFGELVNITTTIDFQKNTKIKYILHFVLEDKMKTPTESVVAIKDVIYKCLHHAENVLQTNSITFPHLGGSDYCDISSFVRGSVEALRMFSSASQRLKRVCFFAKDNKTLQELATGFRLCVDHPHNSHLASSSESSYNGRSTSF